MGWLARGLSAAQHVSERADLWLPGALGALAFFAWLPFVAVVVPWPSAADLAFFGAGFVGTGGVVRALALAVGLFIGLVAASALAAFAEAVLVGWMRTDRHGEPRRPIRSAAVTLFSIHQLCAIPAVAAAVLLVWVFAGVAPAEFQAPDISGGLAFRIWSGVAPYVAVLVAAILLGQLVGGTATRHAAERGASVGQALLGGAGDVFRRPSLVGVAVLTLLAHVAYLGFAFVLLRVLWMPIAPSFAAGQMAHPATPLLLVGFMAIWFCLVLGTGAVHAWTSLWWTVEIAPDGAEADREEAAPSAHPN